MACVTSEFEHHTTERLRLDIPVAADLAQLHELSSDPLVWQHFPSGRHESIEQTRDMLERWQRDWDAAGLGTWIVRTTADDKLIGYGGCVLREVSAGEVWNLGYRFATAAQGRGYATELARAAADCARAHRPEVPVTAYLLETNGGSRRVVEKIGMTLVERRFDDGNPDPTAIRLVFTDRPIDLALIR